MAKFIADNRYSFHVLLDDQSTVVNQFKVKGIPTKFVIDKSGTIRFISKGYEGSDNSLVKHLSAMIEVTAEQGGKVL